MVKDDAIEWPTLVLMVACYSFWAGVTWFASGIGLWIAIPLIAMVLALHSSLQHEVLHGHPFKNARVNETLVFLALWPSASPSLMSGFETPISPITGTSC